MKWLIIALLLAGAACTCLMWYAIKYDRRYLMLSTNYGPPFQYVVKYENRAVMLESQMNAWRARVGAKEITVLEYYTWALSKPFVERRDLLNDIKPKEMED